MSNTTLTQTKNTTFFGYCERGGQEGIVVTTDQLREFAAFLKRKFIDEIIPLPNITREEQKTRIDQSDGQGKLENSVYYETETGGHGWCDRHTGIVTQWG